MENGVELSPALEFHEGSEVWIPIRAHEAQKADSNSLSSSVTNWVSGQVAEVTCNASGEHILTVSTDDNGLSEAKACDCVLRNPTDDMDDLVRSDYLHEPGILETIGVRFAKDTIYTYSGNILIAVNPFKRLRGLYGRLTMSYYRGKQLGEYGPHVYAVAEAAHSAMMMDQQRQAILISGESGAGKTETAKLVMQYLAHRNASPTIAEWQESSSRSKMQNLIEEQVLESNPLLEAFGNAKTSRNDNSSRFGKFVDIDFDEMGNIGGAQICTYLLERSRVVSVASPERSYHIFYQLCAGANDSFKQRWRLGGGAESFRYLAQSSTIVLEGVDDAAAFSQTCESMRIVGIPSDQQEAALQLIAAILHMGNICFADNDADQAQLAGRDAEAALAVVAELLMLPQEELLHSLTTRTIQVAGCAIQKPLTAAQAAASRDALSKTIYARLFDWLVRNINWKLRGSRPWTDSGSRRIGILDIYGFESFEINSFEQLCINLANEKLQQQFNLHVFKHEQAQYEEEGIDWSFISFQDNQDCVEVLEGAHGSVFSLLDEACRLANTTAADLARSLRSTLSEHPRFKAPKLQQGSFIIQHYAGQVQYGCSGLIEKNKDFVVLEHENVAAASQLPLLQELFAGAVPPPTGTAGADSVRGRKSGYKLATIAQRFRTQLTTLMAALGSCNPHYIRCIKPNPCSEPTVIDKASILDQLRAGGVLEAVRVASAGFPTKKVLGPFAVRYAHLLRGCHVQAALQAPLAQPERQQQLARSILQHVQGVLGPDAFSGWQIGRSRVFLLSGQLAMLEGLLRQRQQAAGVCIQAAWRGWCVRRWLRQLRRSAVAIQAAWHGFVAWRRRQRLLEELSASRIQAAWRRHKLEKDAELRRRHDAATVIQKTVRMHLVRMWYRKETQAGRQAALRACQWEAARKLQRCVRRYQARARARAWRREAVRVRELERQVEELGEAAERWEQWCNEAQCRVTQLQAVNVRLQQELLAANALASAAEAKAASAEADAKEHRHAARKAVQKALGQAQKEAEAAQEAAHHARLAMQQAEERAREESARRLELAEEHAREEAARQLEVAEERAQVEAARQLQKAEERAREQAARQLQLAEERAREEAARQLQMAEERARQESARQLERSQRELAEAQQSVVEALQGELKMAKVARAEAQQQVSQLRARLEAQRAEFEAKQEGLEREKRRAAQAQSRLQKSQDISYSLEKRLKAEADGLRARNRKLASDNAAIRSRLESRIYELEHAKAPPNHTGIPRPVHSRASSTTGGTGSEAQSARTRSLEQERDMLREQVDDLRRQVVVLERHASAQGAAGMKRFGSLDRSRVPAGTGLRRQQPSNIPAFVAGTGAAVAARAGRPSCEVGAESSSTDSSGHGGTASPQTAVVKAEAAKVMDTLQVLIQAVMSEPLPLVVLAHTARSFPHAAYLLGRGAAQLCGSWDAAGVRFQAVGALKAALLTAVQQEVGLSRRLYWLGMALASAGMLNVYGQVLQKKLLLDLAQDLAFHDRVHRSVGAVVQQQLHVGPELAIAVGSHLSATPRRAAARKVAGGGEPTSMGRKSVSGAWSELRGQLKNVLDTVRSAGLSPAAERGCVRLVLQLLDANLVNLLMLNRNACSRSSVGSTQRHMGELMRWLVTESGSWGGDKSDIEWGFRRVVQALRYLGGGKEELSRKVRSGIDVQVECSRRCKDLTLAQVYRLTQHHWDDWVAREQQTQGETWGLLEALRRAEYSASTQQAEPAAAAGRNGDAAAAVKVPKDWLNRSTEEGELLIDAVQEFVLDQRVAGASANHYVGVGSREASSVTVQQAAHQVQRACGLLPVPAALQHAESELAMLHPHPQAGDRSPPGPGQPIMNAAGA